jgi:hypothetical protein
MTDDVGAAGAAEAGWQDNLYLICELEESTHPTLATVEMSRRSRTAGTKRTRLLLAVRWPADHIYWTKWSSWLRDRRIESTDQATIFSWLVDGACVSQLRRLASPRSGGPGRSPPGHLALLAGPARRVSAVDPAP